jgi:acetyl esterase/lipase
MALFRTNFTAGTWRSAPVAQGNFDLPGVVVNRISSVVSPRTLPHAIVTFTVLLLALAARVPAAAPTAPTTPSTPPAMRVIPNVAYLAPDRAEKLDVYLPEGRAAGVKSPALVWIHGGSWIGGDKGEARAKEICGTLVGAGYVAVSINYKLGRGAWPQNLLDCKNAVRFLRAHAEEYGIDPDRIAVGGGSAGGHLALMVGFTMGQTELEPTAPYPGVSSAVRAVLDLYGPANLVLPPVAAGSADAFPGMRKVMADARGVFGAEPPPEAVLRAASPTHIAAKGAPPVLIFHGKDDPIVEHTQSVELDKVLTERGVEHVFTLVEGAQHSFDFEISNPSAGTPKLPRDLRPEALAFLAKHLAPKPAPSALTAAMSDEQILRALQLDPAALRAEKTQGKDGTTTVYSDATNEVMITRSMVSGVVVLRTKPVGQTQTWKLGRP